MSFSTVAQAAWLWSPESGKWTNAKDVPRDVPQEQYEAGTQYYDDEDYAGAVDEFDKLIRHYPNSRWAAEGQFYKGLCYEKMGDVGKAAEAFKILIDRYPYSDRLNDAVEHEYELAEAMLDGKKTRFLGMEIIPAEDTASDLFRHIVRSAPYGPYGALAQYRVGDSELAQGNFDEAEKAYQLVIDNYPASEYTPKAKFKIAQVSYKSAIEEEYHHPQTDAALDRFEGFKRAYPDSYLQFEADEAIQALREKKAKDLYQIAFFYQERKKWQSAKLYFRDVLRSFGDTEMAQLAKERLEEIETIEAGGAVSTNRFLGILPVGGEKRPSKEDKPVSEAKETRERKSFLGIIPLGYVDEEEVSEQAKETRKRKSFLGIIPLGYEDEEEVSEEAKNDEREKAKEGSLEQFV